MTALVEKIEKSLAEVLALREQKLAENAAQLRYPKRLSPTSGPRSTTPSPSR